MWLESHIATSMHCEGTSHKGEEQVKEGTTTKGLHIPWVMDKHKARILIHNLTATKIEHLNCHVIPLLQLTMVDIKPSMLVQMS